MRRRLYYPMVCMSWLLGMGLVGWPAVAQDFTVENLGGFGGHVARAYAIHDHGPAAGSAPTADGRTEGAMVGLGARPGYPNSTALDINNDGAVVGYAEHTGGGRRAVLYVDGYGLLDLNDLIDQPGWVLEEATAINDAWQIVGRGTYQGQACAYRLSPTAAGRGAGFAADRPGGMRPAAEGRGSGERVPTGNGAAHLDRSPISQAAGGDSKARGLIQPFVGGDFSPRGRGFPSPSSHLPAAAAGVAGGGLTLPFFGSVSSVFPAFYVVNTGAGSGVLGRNAEAEGYGVQGEGGDVGVSGLVIGDNPDSIGVFGVNTIGFGVVGRSETGIGVRGRSPSGLGVNGESESGVGVGGGSNSGVGVSGISVGSIGVRGRSQSDRGVEGVSQSASGVVGQSTSGRGVQGISEGEIGVAGFSTNNIGVVGQSETTVGVAGFSRNARGVQGESESATGVVGLSTSGRGVQGESQSEIGVAGFSASNHGVYGSSGTFPGVQGRSQSGRGVEGVSLSSDGVVGFSTSGRGVEGQSQSQIGVAGFSTSNIGVAGRSESGTGVFGQGSPAGLFSGSVSVTGNLSVTGALSKGGGSFQIDHPLDPANRYLSHSFVESPDMKNIYDGVAQLDADGEAVVTLPEWFEALNRDFRYQLTAVGAPAPGLHIAQKVGGNRFKIAGGPPGLEVSWQVTGTRQDAWAEKHRIPVEWAKPPAERGHYLHPDLYGQPPEKGVMNVQHPELTRELSPPPGRPGTPGVAARPRP